MSISRELFGSAGADTLVGGAGVDVISAWDGDDLVRGGDGDDLIVGGRGDDTLHGGAGDDILGLIEATLLDGLFLSDEDAGDDVFHGEDGDDVFAMVVSNLTEVSGSAAYGGAGRDTFIVADALNEGRGAIDGGEGVDTVIPDDGYLGQFQFTNVEVLAAGSGLERGVLVGMVRQLNAFDVVDARSIHLNGEGGQLDLSTRLGVSTHPQVWIDAVNVTSALSIIATAASDSISASRFADTIAGGLGSDALVGRAGGDRLDGGDGNDTLAGGAGDDDMAGGAGDDLYHVDSRGDVVMEAADEGVDTVRASLSWSLGDNVEHLVLTGKGGTFGDGNALDNELTGNRAGNVLAGKDGDDTFNGRMGADKLWGGAGDDVFVFDTTLNGRNVDRIGDFGNGDDTIQLGANVFTTLGVGALAASAFQSGHGSATTADARILFTSATGALSYDADGSGSTAAIQFATLKPGLALTADDFVVA